MSKTLAEIAKDLNNAKPKTQLIYAFNGTGKTRLSREFKNLIDPQDGDKNKEDERYRKILYYNACTEDLFYWDNNLEGNAEPKLKIQPNNFIYWVLKDQGQENAIIDNFQRYTSDKLTPSFSADFSEVTFSFKLGNEETTENVKISKGEESNFIWSIFYTLLEQIITILNKPEEEPTNQFNQMEYVFIDDPVSSLDENHLIELAVNLAGLIKSSASKLRFVITTHSPLFYNALFRELKLKSGYILNKLDDGGFKLEEKKGAANTAFAYHLHIKKLIEQAIDQNNVQRYHFTLLRNLYEKTASFLGYENWRDLLEPEPDVKDAYLKRIINFSSHSTLSIEEIAEPTEPEKQIVKFLLEKLIDNYGYRKQGK